MAVPGEAAVPSAAGLVDARTTLRVLEADRSPPPDRAVPAVIAVAVPAAPTWAAVGRLALGTNGYVLTVDTAGSGVAKVKWAAPASGGLSPFLLMGA